MRTPLHTISLSHTRPPPRVTDTLSRAVAHTPNDEYTGSMKRKHGPIRPLSIAKSVMPLIFRWSFLSLSAHAYAHVHSLSQAHIQTHMRTLSHTRIQAQSSSSHMRARTHTQAHSLL